MSRPLTIRLDPPDYERLEGEAKTLGIRPGTLAKVLLHGSLSGTSPRADAARAALDRLGALSSGKPPADAVHLVREARQAIGDDAT